MMDTIPEKLRRIWEERDRSSSEIAEIDIAGKEEEPPELDGLEEAGQILSVPSVRLHQAEPFLVEPAKLHGVQSIDIPSINISNYVPECQKRVPSARLY